MFHRSRVLATLSLVLAVAGFLATDIPRVNADLPPSRWFGQITITEDHELHEFAWRGPGSIPGYVDYTWTLHQQSEYRSQNGWTSTSADDASAHVVYDFYSNMVDTFLGVNDCRGAKQDSKTVTTTTAITADVVVYGAVLPSFEPGNTFAINIYLDR